MVDPTTTNKGYAIPTHGSDVDAWDVPLNGDFAILDKNFGGVLTKALTNANVTLTASEAQNYVIRFTGVLTGNCVITFPQVGSFYCIENMTTGAFYVQLSTGFGGAEVLSTPQGSRTVVFTDGTNVRPTAGSAWPGVQQFCYGTALPAWMGACTVSPWLIMDGTTFSAVTYPALNAVLGGNTLPDFRGRVPVPLDNQGSAGTAGRVTNAGSGIVGTTVGAAGGSQAFTIAQGNLPAVTLATTIAAGQGAHIHTATTTALVFAGSFASSGGLGLPTAVGAVTVNSATLPAMSGTTPLGGSGTAVAGMPPAMMAGIYIIKT